MQNAPPVGCAAAAARPRPCRAARSASGAWTGNAPQTGPAAPGPGQRANHTLGAIRRHRAAPPAPGTSDEGGHGARRGSARPAAVARPPMDARSASLAARHSGQRIARATPRAPLPASAPGAPGRPSAARPAAAGAPHSRQSAPVPSVRKPPAASATRGGAREVYASIAGLTQRVRHGASAARIGPTPARHAACVWPPQITVIEIETGLDLGTFDTEAEAAACLAFAGLQPGQVEFRSDGASHGDQRGAVGPPPARTGGRGYGRASGRQEVVRPPRRRGRGAVMI